MERQIHLKSLNLQSLHFETIFASLERPLRTQSANSESISICCELNGNVSPPIHESHYSLWRWRPNMNAGRIDSSIDYLSLPYWKFFCYLPLDYEERKQRLATKALSSLFNCVDRCFKRFLLLTKPTTAVCQCKQFYGINGTHKDEDLLLPTTATIVSHQEVN